jgi:hypothetical protein
MTDFRSLGVLALSALLGTAPIPMSQSQSEQLVAEGTIVAFHKQWRHPVTPYSSKGTGTPADIWIVRVNRWTSGSVEGTYFLVEYWLYERAVDDKEINRSELRFQFRKPREADGQQPCQGITRVGSTRTFKFRSMRMDDFQRTEPGRTDAIPPLKELPCLIAEKPPGAISTEPRVSGPPDKRP